MCSIHRNSGVPDRHHCLSDCQLFTSGHIYITTKPPQSPALPCHHQHHHHFTAAVHLSRTLGRTTTAHPSALPFHSTAVPLG
ncbi:hypothetical protein M0R45_033006 [Rubus argutus]|uniref:Uncharacterized protein n=1 Tax=Rubus argutus TaxID=59490 RepID=A0AAW1WIW7_RUBAR